MLGIFWAHDATDALADNQATFGADRFAGSADFHGNLSGSAEGRGFARRGAAGIRDDCAREEAVDNASFLEIVRRHFDFHTISGENAHSVNAHAPGQVTM